MSQSFTSASLSVYLASQGVSLTLRTILKKASQDPHSLPVGKKVGGHWIWTQADVDRWVSDKTRLDRTGEAATGDVHGPAFSLDSVEAKLGHYRRLRIGAVAALMGISISCVWKRVSQGRLPTPLKDGSATFWLAGEVAQLLEQQTNSFRNQQQAAVCCAQATPGQMDQSGVRA